MDGFGVSPFIVVSVVGENSIHGDMLAALVVLL